MFGINGLNENHKDINQSSLYASTFTNQQLAIPYLTTLFENMESGYLLGLQSWTSLTSNLSNIQLQQFEKNLSKFKVFMLPEEKVTLKFEYIFKDIQRIFIKKNNPVVILIPSLLFVAENNKILKQFVGYFKKIAKQNKIPIFFIFHGKDNQWLSANPHLFMGLSCIKRIDFNLFQYQLQYWFTPNSVSYQDSYEVEIKENKYYVISTQTIIKDKIQDINLSIDDDLQNDGSQIHIAADALGTENITEDNEQIYLFKNNKVIFESIDFISQGTIILSLHRRDEIKDLGLNCYRLRCKFGLRFKIIIREMKPCTRYTDQNFLTQSGVNLIVPASIRFNRFLNLIYNIQIQKIQCQLAHSIDSLLSLVSSNNSQLKGYTENQKFVAYCHEIIQNYQTTKIEFALIKLSLLPTIDFLTSLSLCHIKRDGDIITASNDCLYLLLPSVRQVDINTALNHIFKLPVYNLFKNITIFTTISDIQNQLTDIVTKATIIDEETLKKLTTEQPSFIESKKQNTEWNYAKHKPLTHF